MQSKDAYKLFILLAILLGGILRFMPVALAGFPVNDGGMFYVMVEELQANHFLLPAFTHYNLASIPYAYPPLGFYATAVVSSLLHVSALDIIRWLPPLVSTLSLLAFYFMANELLHSCQQAALGTLFYALVPVSFGWPIMGGGITRSFGLVFLFLTIAWANRLFTQTSSTALKTSSSLLTAQTAFFGALAFLSHPETGLQSAAACVLLWLFHGRTKKTLLWSLAIAGGVALLSAPWWATVMVQHGLAPFQSALHSSNDGTSSALVSLLTLQISGGTFFNLALALGLVGLLAMLARRAFFLPVWLVLPLVVDPRSAGGVAMMSMSLLAGYGFDAVVAPALLSLQKKDGVWLADRFMILSFYAMIFYSFFGASVFGLGLARNSLSTGERRTIAWVDANIPPGSNFLLLTGEQYSMNDPFQEWFPALVAQHSQTTLQGAEWTLGADFFPRYGELVSLQHCADVACIRGWTARTGLGHQYLLINTGASPLRASLLQLAKSVRESGDYRAEYETSDVVIFERLE